MVFRLTSVRLLVAEDEVDAELLPPLQMISTKALGFVFRVWLIFCVRKLDDTILDDDDTVGSTFSLGVVLDDGVGADDDGPFGGVIGGGNTDGDELDCWGCLLMKALLTGVITYINFYNYKFFKSEI